MTKYTVVYTEETEGGFSCRCLELPGAISQGETLEESEMVVVTHCRELAIILASKEYSRTLRCLKRF